MIRRLRDWWAGRGRRGAQGKVDADLDWAPGDIAECIVRSDWLDVVQGPISFGPQYGELYRVAFISHGRVFGSNAAPGISLGFSAWPGRHWHSASFRKVQPRPDLAEAADKAFITTFNPPPELVR